MTAIASKARAGEDERLPEFPADIFPDPLEHFVRQAASSLPGPVDFVAAPSLCVLATAIGNSRALELKDGWSEGARLFSAVVGDPGTKKSPALAIALAPMERHQAELTESYAANTAAYREGVERSTVMQAQWREEVKRAAKEGQTEPLPMPDEPEAPAYQQVFTTDPTVEALSHLLWRNPRGVLCVRDELLGWVRSMDQYRNGRGADRQAWLSIWSGATVIVNRKSEPEPVVLRKPFICVTGAMPPAVASEFLDSGSRDDGFLQRILFAYPQAEQTRWTDVTVDAGLADAYDSVYRALSELQPDSYDKRGGMVPKVRTLGRSARSEFAAWTDRHFAELEGLDPRLRGPWAKLEAYCARFALVLHEINGVCAGSEGSTIDGATVAAAVRLTEYHKAQTRRMYEDIAPQRLSRTGAAMRWIMARGGTVTSRDVQRAKLAGVTTAAEAVALLREFESSGLGKLRFEPRGRVIFTAADARHSTEAPGEVARISSEPAA